VMGFSRRFLFFLVVVDIPVLIIAVAVSHDDPVGTARSVMEWREAHPWSMIPTVMLTLWLCWRTYMRRPV
jgi:hypothetical protein